MSESSTRRTPHFVQQEPERLPNLICLGYVTGLDEPVVTSSGLNIRQPVTIRGYKGSRGARINLLHRPEWFGPDFDRNQLESRGDRFLHVKLFGTAGTKRSKGKIGQLQGLCGSIDAYTELSEAILNVTEYTADSIYQCLKKFFKERTGNLIGYIQKQRREKDEEGNYHNTEYYEVTDFYEASEENIEDWVSVAEKSKSKAEEKGERPGWVVTFELEG